VLADPLDVPDRPQPPREPVRVDHRGFDGLPGAAGRLPAECATIGQVLQDNGYATMWLGKNHNVPVEDLSPAGSRSEWPLSKGFDRFYGFLGGETNQWYPDLIEDNHAIEPPYTPEEGYHLSRTWPTRPSRCCRICGPRVRRSRGSWFCPGANHAPHHSPQEYIDKYKGVFDDGYEAYREWCWPG
jgi:arylsulfatase